MFFQQRLGILFDIVHPLLDDRTALGLYRLPVDGQARKPSGLGLHGFLYILWSHDAIVGGIIKRRECFGFSRFIVVGAVRSPPFVFIVVTHGSERSVFHEMGGAGIIGRIVGRSEERRAWKEGGVQCGLRGWEY